MSRRNFSQPSLADAFVKAYSRGSGFLEDIAKTFEWGAFDVLMRPLHSSSEGAPAYPPLAMFKIVLLQQWYGLSDAGAEEAVRDRLGMRPYLDCRLARALHTASTTRNGPTSWHRRRVGRRSPDPNARSGSGCAHARQQ